MNQDDRLLITDILSQQTEPIDRMELLIATGILEIEHFNRLVSQMEAEGEIIIIKRKKVALPSVVGCLRATVVRQSKHFLFAQPEDPDHEDVFVNASSSKGAMPGDLVMLKNIRDSEKGPYGEIDKIIRKGSRIITGMVERERGKAGKAFVIPDNGFAYSLPVVRGGELKSKNGDKVKAAISFDQKEKKIVARIIHIYGRADSARVCSDAIIDANGIPSKFTVAVKHEAAVKAAEPQAPH